MASAPAARTVGGSQQPVTPTILASSGTCTDMHRAHM